MTIFICTITICAASPIARIQTKVFSQGMTNIIDGFEGVKIIVKISTNQIDIGKASDDQPQKKITNCTYSRFPCSLVNHMEISVNGNSLFVARSVYADLADVDAATLRQKRKGQYIVSLDGGDASESYTVEITFDDNMVTQRLFKSNLDGQIMQKTTYFKPLSLDD